LSGRGANVEHLLVHPLGILRHDVHRAFSRIVGGNRSITYHLLPEDDPSDAADTTEARELLG
jgi:hypothetical protein